MSAEKIINQIKKDSEKEVKQILDEAKKQALIIIDNVKKDAKIEAEKIIGGGKTQSENVKKILISQANQDAKRDAMNAKEDIIEDCFTKAHHELSILKGTNYETLSGKLIEGGRNKLGGNCSVLFSRAADKKIAETLGISIHGRIEASGGVILKSEDGRITLDHTFDGILKREKDKMRIKVGKLLFS